MDITIKHESLLQMAIEQVLDNLCPGNLLCRKQIGRPIVKYILQQKSTPLQNFF
jgi:hypothetical protein